MNLTDWLAAMPLDISSRSESSSTLLARVRLCGRMPHVRLDPMYSSPLTCSFAYKPLFYIDL